MQQVEQAVFTSAETGRSAGYHVVANSPGVCEADLRELAVWGPSHDSLLDSGPDAVSLNFHPLPSGAFCVSRTTPAGWEYSGRGGHRVYTQCLIVSADVLARFANNPFALMKAAVAGGMTAVHDNVPRQLGPLRLVGGAAPVDAALLANLAADPGPQAVSTLVQAATDSVCLAVSGTPSAAELIAGLLQCLPPECRTEFSFSTGLKFSSRRAFRIVTLSGDESERRWLARRPNVTVLSLGEGWPLPATPIDGWARLIGRVLASDRMSFLSTQLSKRRFQLSTTDLPALGLQLLEEFEATALRTDHRSADEPVTPPTPTAPEDLQQAHAAHSTFAKSTRGAATEPCKAAAPSKVIQPASAEDLEKLELLDDLVYEAIGGQAGALDQLQTAWPKVLSELGDELVAESREQYLRYALSIWDECLDPTGVRNPTRVLAATDVLCVLFDAVP